MYKIFGKPSCSFCIKAKNLLDRKGEEYIYTDILEDNDAYDFIVNYSGFRSVPQVYHNEEHVGGYDELVNYLAGGDDD